MIVIESSAMVDALVDQPVDPHLLALLADEELHAPALLDFEVASARAAMHWVADLTRSGSRRPSTTSAASGSNVTR